MALLSLQKYSNGERRMTILLNAIPITRVEEIYAQLIEHFGERFFDPVEATNKATDFLSKYYFNIKA